MWGVFSMSTMVVQERHLWLNLAEMKDVSKPPSPVEGFAQQFSAVHQQTEAIQHRCPRGQASVCPSQWVPSCVLQSCSAPGRIDTWAGALSLSQESGAPRVPARPPVVQEVDEAALTRATRRCWNLLFLRRRREQRSSFPPWRAGRRIFRFCSAAGPRDPLSQERAISFSSGFSGPWDDSV